jgi:drug/metabolite transporter (DMT)-like permease
MPPCCCTESELPFTNAGSYAAVLGYCVVTAVSLITIHETGRSIPPPAITLSTFLVATVFFTLATTRTLRKTFSIVRADKRGFLAINLTTAATWLTGFWAVKYLAPDLFLAIFMGVAPLATFTIRTLLFRCKGTTKELFAAMLVTLTVAAIVGEHTVLAGLYVPSLAGLLLATVSGVSFSFYLVYSKRMEGLSPAGILSVRFYLLIVVSLLLTTMNYDLADVAARISVPKIVLISLGSAILPLYLLQTAITRLGAARVANFVPFTCVVTYLAEQLILLHPFSLAVFLTILLLCALISYAAKAGSTNS